jgi:hypothetical protein
MAMQMGFLEKEQTKQKSSGLQELKAQRYSIEDKSRSVTFHPALSYIGCLCVAPLPTVYGKEGARVPSLKSETTASTR